MISLKFISGYSHSVCRALGKGSFSSQSFQVRRGGGTQKLVWRVIVRYLRKLRIQDLVQFTGRKQNFQDSKLD